MPDESIAYDDGGPAFPRTPSLSTNGQVGMSLRDYFAAKAMAGMLACNKSASFDAAEPIAVARSAYRYADALLAERAK